MLNTVIIADDLTGANDTGAILAHDGFKVGTILKRDQMQQFEDYDVLCVSCNSRGLSKEDAYGEIQEAAKLFPVSDSILYSKRIDSTLRGNVGSEIDSILDHLGEDYRAVVVASFPQSGRVSVGDILLVNGVPLQSTEVAKDPTAPVHTSKITDVVRKQSKHKVGYIGLERVLKGSGELLLDITEAAKQYKIIVIDAQTLHDIDAIAACCAGSGLKIVAVDPGAFTASLANHLFKRKREEIQKKLLCGVGSATDLTRLQLQYLKKNANPLIVKINTDQLFAEEKRNCEMNRVIESVISQEESYGTLVVTTSLTRDDILDLSKIEDAKDLSKKECASIITDSIASIIFELLHKLGDRVGGVYATGGDVSAAFCDKLGISGFNVRGEVIPLAIYSKAIGGCVNDLPMITKGGLVGKEDTMVQCLEYFDTVI